MNLTNDERLVQRISDEIKTLSNLWMKRKRNLTLLKEGAKKIKKLMEMCTVCGDCKIKEIGDRVIIWDITGLTLKSSSSICSHSGKKIEEILNSECIVISDHETYVSEPIIYGEKAKILDLIVWNKKTNQLLRTSSECVKLKTTKKEPMLRDRSRVASS